MAVSQSQIVDLLYKQAFGVTKTDTATNKSPSNENIPSPLLIRGDTIWTQADQIPSTATATAGIVQAYTGVNAIECIADNTTVPIGGIYPTWLTELTYWIPSEFGSTYTAQVWVDSPGVANPTLTGTQIFAAGSGGTGQYYYNYQSGVLNFIGETIPAALTSGKVLYIVGYRYIGEVGVTNLPNNTTIGNLNFTGTTISSTTANGNIIIAPNGSGIVQVSSALTSNANITANFYIGNGSLLTGVAASNAVSAGTVTDNAQPNITSVGTLISLNVSGNVTANNFIGTLANGNSNVNIPNVNGNINLTATGNTTVVVTGTGVNVEGNLNTTGSVSLGGGTGGNLTGANVISANIVSANLLATTSNVSSNSITNNLTVNLALSGNTANFTGNIITLNANLGNAASANYFIGNGSLLTGVAASNSVSAGTVTNNAQPNITSVGTLISLDISGNLSAGNANLGNLVIANFFSGSGANLTNIPAGNISGQVANALVAGTVYTNAQPNITSVGTLTSLSVTGDISSGNANLGNLVTANFFSGSGNLLSNIQGSNVTGNVTSAVTANFANYAGNVTLAAQSNITSVGTLTSLAVTGNISSGNANLGNLATANFFSGSGNNLSNIQGSNVTGQVGNALVAGTVYTNAQPNITSTGTLTSLTVSGHLTANTFQMGYGIYAFYSTSVYFATTASTSANQLLWDYPAADLSAIDFTIIATDNVGATRQSCKISAAILGTTVAYNEYGGLFINGGVGSFSVIYNGSGPTPTLELVVTPDSSNLTEYNMLISKYLV